MAQLQFDARNVAPDTGGGDPLPAGWYNVAVDESAMKPTSDGTGAYLELRLNVLDGQFANRKLFTRLNLRNSNTQAQEIAFKQLSAICHAIGRLQINDSQELHGQPLKVKATVRGARPKLDGNGNPTGEQYEASNDVKAYKGINEPTDMAAATAPQVGQPQGFATGGLPQGFAPQGQPQGFAPQPQAQQPAQAQPWGGQQQPQQPQQPVAGAPQGFAPQQPQQPAQAPQYAPQPQAQQPMQQPQQFTQPAPAPAPIAQPWTQPQQQPQAPVQYAPQQPMQPAQPGFAPAMTPAHGQPMQAVPPWGQPQA